MLLRQFVDEDLGCASYLVGDVDAGEAVWSTRVCDRAVPRRGGATGRPDRARLETHTHADHVSGHGRLALEHGIPVSVHSEAGAEFPHDPLADGDEIAVGCGSDPLPAHARPPARALLLPRSTSAAA
jgi:glyoxylase-like metal-dependent hydrolase (beta-lactamase superfamily II)